MGTISDLPEASKYTATAGATLSIVGCLAMVCSSWWRVRRGDRTFGLTAHLVTCLALSDLFYSVNLVGLQSIHFMLHELPPSTCTWWGILDNFFSTATICWTAMVAVDLIDFTCRASGEGELAARDVWKRKVGYHVCVYATSAVLTLPIIVFAVLSTFTAYEPIVALSSIGGCFISDTATGKWVGFLLVTVPKAVGLLFNCAAYVIAVQRVCSRRFPTVVGRRHAAQTSRFLLVYLLCYAAPAVRHIWVLLDTPTSMWYEILQFVESILLPLAGFLNAVVYGLNRNFSTGSGLRALLRGESGVMVGENKTVSFKDFRYLNADECAGKEWRDSQYRRIQNETAERQAQRNDIIRRVQPTLDRLSCDIREIGAVLDHYQALDDEMVATMLGASSADVSRDVERHVMRLRSTLSALAPPLSEGQRKRTYLHTPRPSRSNLHALPGAIGVMGVMGVVGGGGGTAVPAASGRAPSADAGGMDEPLLAQALTQAFGGSDGDADADASCLGTSIDSTGSLNA